MRKYFLPGALALALVGLTACETSMQTLNAFKSARDVAEATKEVICERFDENDPFRVALREKLDDLGQAVELAKSAGYDPYCPKAE